MITVTEQAINRIQEVSKKKKTGSFFRISISGGGCQGFQYNFKFEEKSNSDDEIFNFKGNALEWNNNHFQDEFVMVLEKAASRYEELSISKKVKHYDRYRLPS